MKFLVHNHSLKHWPFTYNKFNHSMNETKQLSISWNNNTNDWIVQILQNVRLKKKNTVEPVLIVRLYWLQIASLPKLAFNRFTKKLARTVRDSRSNENIVASLVIRSFLYSQFSYTVAKYKCQGGCTNEKERDRDVPTNCPAMQTSGYVCSITIVGVK